MFNYRVRWYAAGAAALLLAACAGRGRGADAAPEPEDLRRGLVTIFQDQAKPTPAEVVRLEPTVALALQAGEAAHPRSGGGRRYGRLEGIPQRPAKRQLSIPRRTCAASSG